MLQFLGDDSFVKWRVCNFFPRGQRNKWGRETHASKKSGYGSGPEWGPVGCPGEDSRHREGKLVFVARKFENEQERRSMPVILLVCGYLREDNGKEGRPLLGTRRVLGGGRLVSQVITQPQKKGLKYLVIRRIGTVRV